MSVDTLGGMVDQPAFDSGKTAKGSDVSAEILQVLNKLNEAIGLANTNEGDISSNSTANGAQHTIFENYINNLLSRMTALDDSSTGTVTVDHEDRITANEGDISDMQAGGFIGGPLNVVGNITTFAHGTYGNYGQILLNDTTGTQSVNLGQPSTLGWSEGNRLYLICRNADGAYISSNYLAPAGVAKKALMADGDVVMLTVVNDTGYTGMLRWNIARMPRADGMNDCKILSATETYNMPLGLPYRLFTAEAQSSSSDMATINLPALTDQLIGTQIKVMHILSYGSINIVAAGTDRIVSSGGTVVGNIVISDNLGKGVAILTAYPSVDGVRYWSSTSD